MNTVDRKASSVSYGGCVTVARRDQARRNRSVQVRLLMALMLSAIMVFTGLSVVSMSAATSSITALAITKDVTPNSGVLPGDIVTYTISVSNDGTGGAVFGTLTDVLPEDIIYFGFVSGPAGTTWGQTIGWQGSLNSGTTLTWRFTGLVLPNSSFHPRAVPNTAYFDDGTQVLSDTTLFAVAQPLAISKVVTPQLGVLPGGTVTYTITINNYARIPLANVVMTDVLPSPMAFGGVVSGPISNTHPLLWTGTLPGFGQETFVFTATLRGGTLNLGTATLTLPARLVTNTALLQHTIATPPIADAASFAVGNPFVINKSVSPELVSPGSFVTYTIMMGNVAHAPVSQVMMTDVLPLGTTFDSWLVRPPGVSLSGNAMTWMGTLSSMSPISLTFKAYFTDTDLLPGAREVFNDAYLSHSIGVAHSRVRFVIEQDYQAFLPIVLHRHDPLHNGSFEKGLYGWTIPSDALMPAQIVSQTVEQQEWDVPGTLPKTDPVDGSFILLLGDPEYECHNVPKNTYAGVAQSLAVPEDAQRLTFDYMIWSEDVSLDQYTDRFAVYIDDTQVHFDGNQINDPGCGKWRRVPGYDNPRPGIGGGTTESGWTEAVINLEPYRGRIITLSFRNYNWLDTSYNTYTYVDNVVIE